MQKLSKRNTYTPTNTPLIRSNCDPELNSSQGKNSVQDLKTLDNNSEVVSSQHKGSSNLRVSNVVYVLNRRKEPLMPTSQQCANRLLRENRAKVVSVSPFTIQLKESTGETRQAVILGIDTGYKTIGVSARTEKKELLAAEVKLRENLVKLNSERKMYRRTRRNKLWYRQPRFLNRGNKKDGWLAPSIRHKLDSHLRIVEKAHRILPVTEIAVEISKFDIQKIQNPEIEKTDYQEGAQKYFNNVKEYVRYRDGYSCQNCKNKNSVLHVHHIESRKTGGDRPENLITLCNKCHEDYHNGKIFLNVKHSDGFKSESFMNSIYRKLLEELKIKYINVKETFGYITKTLRKEYNISKNHVNDAFCIAGGIAQKRDNIRVVEQKRRNNRCLQIFRKGHDRSIRRKRYAIQPKDIVIVGKEKFESAGMYHYGTGVVVRKNNERKNINMKYVDSWINRNGMIWSY